MRLETETHAAAIRMFTSLRIWDSGSSGINWTPEEPEEEDEGEGGTGGKNTRRRRADVSASSGSCNSYVGVKEFM